MNNKPFIQYFPSRLAMCHGSSLLSEREMLNMIQSSKSSGSAGSTLRFSISLCQGSGETRAQLSSVSAGNAGPPSCWEPERCEPHSSPPPSQGPPRFVVGKLYGIRVDLLWTPGGLAVQLAKLGHGNLVSITKNVKNSNLTLFKNVNTLTMPLWEVFM